MVRDGYAVAMKRYSLEPEYIGRLDRMERFSRKSNNGLWKSHAQAISDWCLRSR